MKFTNKFGPALSLLARCFPESRAWYEIDFRVKFHKPLVQFKFVPGSARNAAETPKIEKTKKKKKNRHQIARNHNFHIYAVPWARPHFPQ